MPIFMVLSSKVVSGGAKLQIPGMTKGRVVLPFGLVAGGIEQQVPPLRCAPVGMTNLLQRRSFPEELSIAK
jgi:hypothetical protein